MEEAVKLSKKDADLFFELMFPLQLYVNQTQQIFPEVQSLADYVALDTQSQKMVRDELWKNPALIAQYVAENPNQLSPAHLAIVASWQSFFKERFIVERYLKKYAIFIGNDQVYGVLGLHSSFDEMIPKAALPVFVETVLLPFGDDIVYDGLMTGGNILIGRNMALGFKETYMEAKREGKLIVSFNPDVQAQAKAELKINLKDWRPALDSLSEEAKKLRAQSGSPPTWGPAFSLVKASLALAKTAVSSPKDQETLWEDFERIVRSVNKLEDSIFRS